MKNSEGSTMSPLKIWVQLGGETLILEIHELDIC